LANAGKVFKRRMQRGANRAARALRLAAQGCHHGRNALGTFYRRIHVRASGAKAVVATARKIAERVYRLLKYGQEYVRQSEEAYEAAYRLRLENLERLGISAERVRLVVNRYGRAGEVPYGKAEEALRRKIVHYVPDDPKTINRANNNGVPAVLEAPAARVCQSIAKLAKSVATLSEPPR
jgi:hypothetical protein